MSSAPEARASHTPQSPAHPRGVVDPRAPRVAAALTAALLLIGVFVALLGPSASPSAFAAGGFAARVSDPGFWILAAVALLFAWSLVSPRSHPFATLYRVLLAPRLAPPAEWEDARPPRFAQGVGLAVVGAGLGLHLLGVPFALVVGGAAAFLAAFLNAAFGFCLGCELYLLLVRAGVLQRGRA